MEENNRIADAVETDCGTVVFITEEELQSSLIIDENGEPIPYEDMYIISEDETLHQENVQSMSILNFDETMLGEDAMQEDELEDNIESRVWICKETRSECDKGRPKCVSCDVTFSSVFDLREHLDENHYLNMDMEEHEFITMKAFKEWKEEIEKKTHSVFILQPGDNINWFYTCNYSDATMKWDDPTSDIIELDEPKIPCTAAIYCKKFSNKIKVKYCPTHYAHEIFYKDNIDERNSLRNWVNQCSTFQGNSPVIYSSLSDNKPSFVLVIMSEYQKYMLMTAERQLICIDTIDGGEIQFSIAYVVDENDNVFPVSFCLSDETTTEVLELFFISIKETVGHLQFTYFMSASHSMYYEMWCKVMECTSCWLLNQWSVSNKIVEELKSVQISFSERNKLKRYLRTLMVCEDVNLFNTLFVEFIEYLKRNSKTDKLCLWLEEELRSNRCSWAYCYRKDISKHVNTRLYLMHQNFIFCQKKIRPDRIDDCVLVLMKFVKRKILEKVQAEHNEDGGTGFLMRIAENFNDLGMLVFEGYRHSYFHELGMSISPKRISLACHKNWYVKTSREEEVASVTRELPSCPESCSFRCSQCDVCIHMFSCDCVQNLINVNLCHHIHAVANEVLLQTFLHEDSLEEKRSNLNDLQEDPLDSKCRNLDDDCGSNDASSQDRSTLEEEVVLCFNELFKVLKKKKLEITNSAHDSISRKLTECADICTGTYVSKSYKDVGTNTVKCKKHFYSKKSEKHRIRK